VRAGLCLSTTFPYLCRAPCALCYRNCDAFNAKIYNLSDTLTDVRLIFVDADVSRSAFAAAAASVSAACVALRLGCVTSLLIVGATRRHYMIASNAGFHDPARFPR